MTYKDVNSYKKEIALFQGYFFGGRALRLYKNRFLPPPTLLILKSHAKLRDDSFIHSRVMVILCYIQHRPMYVHPYRNKHTRENFLNLFFSISISHKNAKKLKNLKVPCVNKSYFIKRESIVRFIVDNRFSINSWRKVWKQKENTWFKFFSVRKIIW